MKKPFLFLILGILPLSFFLVAYQSFLYEQKETRVNELLAKQRDLFEENKRLLARLSGLEAPKSVIERATKELGMQFPDQKQVIKLRVEGGQGGN